MSIEKINLFTDEEQKKIERIENKIKKQIKQELFDNKNSPEENNDGEIIEKLTLELKNEDIEKREVAAKDLFIVYSNSKLKEKISLIVKDSFLYVTQNKIAFGPRQIILFSVIPTLSEKFFKLTFEQTLGKKNVIIPAEMFEAWMVLATHKNFPEELIKPFFDILMQQSFSEKLYDDIMKLMVLFSSKLSTEEINEKNEFLKKNLSKDNLYINYKICTEINSGKTQFFSMVAKLLFDEIFDLRKNISKNNSIEKNKMRAEFLIQLLPADDFYLFFRLFLDKKNIQNLTKNLKKDKKIFEAVILDPILANPGMITIEQIELFCTLAPHMILKEGPNEKTYAVIEIFNANSILSEEQVSTLFELLFENKDSVCVTNLLSLLIFNPQLSEKQKEKFLALYGNGDDHFMTIFVAIKIRSYPNLPDKLIKFIDNHLVKRIISEKNTYFYLQLYRLGPLQKLPDLMLKEIETAFLDFLINMKTLSIEKINALSVYIPYSKFPEDDECLLETIKKIELLEKISYKIIDSLDDKNENASQAAAKILLMLLKNLPENRTIIFRKKIIEMLKKKQTSAALNTLGKLIPTKDFIEILEKMLTDDNSDFREAAAKTLIQHYFESKKISEEFIEVIVNFQKYLDNNKEKIFGIAQFMLPLFVIKNFIEFSDQAKKLMVEFSKEANGLNDSDAFFSKIIDVLFKLTVDKEFSKEQTHELLNLLISKPIKDKSKLSMTMQNSGAYKIANMMKWKTSFFANGIIKCLNAIRDKTGDDELYSEELKLEELEKNNNTCIIG